MSTSGVDNSDDLVDKLRKLEKRQARNNRAAHAKGLLLGICSMLKPGDIVLDCGANVGELTVPLSRTGADVHAFEPDLYAFSKLSKATEGLANVTLHNAAVGTNSGSVTLMRADNFDDNPRGASVKSTVISGGRKIVEQGDNTIEVELVSLPEIISNLADRYGEITLLKMDIEGAELEILEWMLEHELFDKVRLTVAETHEKKFRRLRPRFEELRAQITKAYPKTKVNLDWI